MRLELLSESDLSAMNSLCARSLSDPPSLEELRRTLFAPDQPARLRGDPGVGFVATVLGEESVGTAGHGFMRLLVVAPEHRGAGLGRALISAAEADLRDAGARSVTTGAEAPHYLWPGVEATETSLLCLLERLHYGRTETHFNMDLDLSVIPPDPGGWFAATDAERAELEEWATAHWLNWRTEMLGALDRDTLVITRDGDGIAAVCAYDVTRAGWIGPVAVRPNLLGKGAGVAALLGALHRMRTAGRSRVEIGWVGPIVPYARVGATVGRVFFVHRKELR
jgi:GNAT superfamily N-acetyltransferase